MTLDENTNHYVLQNVDLVNEIGYDLEQNACVIGGGNATKKAQWFLKLLSKVVYGAMESRQEGKYLVEKFNEKGTTYIKNILIAQFMYWEDSDVDILQAYTKGIAPSVEKDLRNDGFLFEGRILR